MPLSTHAFSFRVGSIPSIATISPGGTWNGAAGSGYGGLPPILTGQTIANIAYAGHMGSSAGSHVNGTKAPSGQFVFTSKFIPDGPFTGSITIAVLATDKTDGASVTFHCEGNTATVTESQRTLMALPTWGGTTRYQRVYAVTLNHAAMSNGALDIYATISAPGCTDRVLGPLRQYRRTAPDRSINIGTGEPTVAGVSYPTFQAAIQYCQSNSTDAWIKLNLTSNLTVNPAVTAMGTTIATSASRRGIIEVDPGIHTFTGSRTTKGSWRPQVNGLVFRDCVFDCTNIDQVWAEDGITGSAGYRPSFYIGCDFTGAGQYEIYDNQTLRNSGIFRVHTALLGCRVRDMNVQQINATISIGNLFERCSGDTCFVNGWTSTTAIAAPVLMLKNYAIDCSAETYRTGVNAWSYTYGGAGVATVELTGTHNNAARTATAKVDGITVGTFTASTTVGSGNYLVSNFVASANAALGALGWTFTTLDDTRRFATSGNETGTQVVVPSEVVKTYFWLHADGMQLAASVQHDNTIIEGNFFGNIHMQFFPSPQTSTNGVWNCSFRNNVLGLNTGAGSDVDLFTQLSGQWHNTWIDHNTFANQGLYVRFDLSAASFDSDSSIRCNVWRKGTPLGAGTNNASTGSNHFFEGTTLGWAGGTTGGTTTGDYPGLLTTPTAIATYTPAAGQQIASNLKTSVYKYDFNGKRRAASDQGGAIAA